MSTQSIPKPTSLYPVDELPSASFNGFGKVQWRWIIRYFGGILALVVLMTIVLSVVFAERVTSQPPTAGMDLRARFIPPFWMEGGSMDHPFGTDNLGRDVLSRTLHGGRISLRVALVASSLASVIGITLGLIGGYKGGFLDRLLVLVTDAWISFPSLILALAVIAVVGTTPNILITLLVALGWVYPARVTRAQTLKIRRLEYVQASVMLGGSTLHTIRNHILPNVVSVNVVLWTFSVSTLVLIEGSLSFVGLGVSPPSPSWGNMLSDGQYHMQEAWWLAVFPGLALMLTILCLNTLGDTLQAMRSR